MPSLQNNQIKKKKKKKTFTLSEIITVTSLGLFFPL